MGGEGSGGERFLRIRNVSSICITSEIWQDFTNILITGSEQGVLETSTCFKLNEGGEFYLWRILDWLNSLKKKKTCLSASQHNKGCATHPVALPFTFKSILRQKKNYVNSNISPCKNITFKGILLKRNQNPSRYYNSMITNLKFQHKSKYHLSKILI
jgi:hypothetical protein